VVDADVLAREVVAGGTSALEAIVQRFGAGVLTPEGSLDRARLGAIVFQDDAARRDLEAIVHPQVRRRIDEFFAQLPRGTAFAIADIPLLYETGRENDFDQVIVVASARPAQIERVIARDGLTREDAERRVAAQWPIEDKVARADYVIRSDGTFAETEAQVAQLLRSLRS
jgi:dephospho-CoA kinase